MIKNTQQIIKKLKTDTGEISDIVYRKIIIKNHDVNIIYNEPLTSGDKISDFIIKSLNFIDFNDKKNSLIHNIKNNITNFKVLEFKTYDELCFYLHHGFTIILVENCGIGMALETKAILNRSISNPTAENTIRGSKDAFIEDYQTNIGLIKKRIRHNDLRIKSIVCGKYSQTQVGILSINGICDDKLLKNIIKKFEKIKINGVFSTDILKNLINDENKSLLPTIQTTERPDLACQALLNGKIIIVSDDCPYALIIPTFMIDLMKTSDDCYSNSINTSFTRILKLIAFLISLLAPAIYISLITFNQEILPTKLLVNFSIQRDGVPLPAFFEAIIMIFSFEIIREADFRVPTNAGSSLSILGAIVLGDAAVNAGIISPIMIIVVAIAAICSLLFTEMELVNGMRIYRLLFMIGATTFGLIGVMITFLYFIINLISLKSFGYPYLIPFAPFNKRLFKNSIIKYPTKNLIKNEAEN